MIATARGDSSPFEPNSPPMVEGEIWTMMAHIVRRPEVLVEARGHLRPGHFDRPGEAYLAALLRIVYDFAGRDLALLNFTAVWEEARALVDRAGSAIDDEQADLLLGG